MLHNVTLWIRLLGWRGAGWAPVRRQPRCEMVVIGHGRQTPEDIAQTEQRIDPVPAARADDEIDDGRALAGVRMTDEGPVLRGCARDGSAKPTPLTPA